MIDKKLYISANANNCDMRKYLTLFMIGLLAFSCKNESKKPVEPQKEVTFAKFGKEIIADDAIAAASMVQHYEGLKTGDSIDSKLLGTVKEVCQAKGCWMKVALDDNNEVMVKFKDYSFFMPMNIAGEEVIINGKAFVSEVPVNELRHYAEDAGRSAEEIAAITEPRRTYSFEADGVLLKQ